MNIQTYHSSSKAIHPDAAEPVGFLLVSEGERLLFITDSQYVPIRFRGSAHILAIECNYDLEILKQNVNSGKTSIDLAKLIIKNHMSLEKAKRFFRANDMSKVREIHLCHLSNSNSDAARFKAEIQAIAGLFTSEGNEKKMDAHLILFRQQPSQDTDVLYIMWHTGSGQMPSPHLYNTPGMRDYIWAWVPDKRMRRGLTTKSCQEAHAKCGKDQYYRPPRGGNATPVRIFGGKKWKWYWLYKIDNQTRPVYVAGDGEKA